MSFSMLRNHFKQTPSHQLFQAICSSLEAWNEGPVEVAIDYCQEHMKGWDDEFRMTTNLAWDEKIPIWWPLVRSHTEHGLTTIRRKWKKQELFQYLTRLDLSFSDSFRGDIEGLFDFLPQLKELSLKNYTRLKLNDLHKLKNLQSLSIDCCDRVEEVNTQKGPTSLTNLHLKESPCFDGMESYFENLVSLHLSNTRDEDLYLPGHNLTTLTVYNCEDLERICFSKDSNQLNTLHITGSPNLKSIEELLKLKQLTSLHLSNCRSVQDLHMIGELHSLTRLTLSDWTSLQNLDFLTNLSRLEHLEITFCSSLSNIDGIQNLTNLQTLCLADCQELENIEALQSLTKLTSLDLSACSSLQQIDALRDLDTITTLKLHECTSLEQIDGLQHLSLLTKLDLHGCSSLTSIGGLRELTKLTELELFDCEELADVEVLQNLHELKRLTLFGCDSLLVEPVSYDMETREEVQGYITQISQP